MATEDDVLFAELSKRLALLIMEEEEENGGAAGGAAKEEQFWERHVDAFSLQAAFSHVCAAAPPFQEAAWPPGRGISGTGVFIPQSHVPSKKKGGAARAAAERPGGAAGRRFHQRRAPPPRHMRL
ncbi:uncharacterized protein LOC144706364 [Wolffia australiana]